MPFDFKKAYSDLYLPKAAPAIIDVPPLLFFAVDGIGDPNMQDGAYQKAVALLYALSYTVKMSKLNKNAPEGYFEYVVPPLEGLWQTANGTAEMDCACKAEFRWTAMIRQPPFVTEDVFAFACAEVRRKKGLDPSDARLWTYEEGLCVQCLHIGPYDDELATVQALRRFMSENRLSPDFCGGRRHHEIYLGDPRRTRPERLRTVLRLPVCKE